MIATLALLAALSGQVTAADCRPNEFFVDHDADGGKIEPTCIKRRDERPPTLPAEGKTWAQGPAATGTDIKEMCSSPPGSENDTLCRIFINGFVHGVIQDQLATENGTPICIPEHTTGDQVRAVLLEYIRQAPKVGPFPADSVLGMALMLGFPCKKEN
jgi:hypothetical protein